MADISSYLQAIMEAIYGEDVRGSIHDAIEIINDVSEVVLTTGTAVDGPTSSSTGFFKDSLYLNTDTYELWKCVATDAWQSQGILKGDKGDDGEDGANGNKWYRGIGISGKAINPTVYSGSGVADANVNDFYLNPTEASIYYCVTGGDANTATWAYDFTMSGGGGGGTSDYNDLLNKPSINGTTLAGNKTAADLGLVESADLATVATSGSYADLLNKPTIPAAQVNADWDAVSGVEQILNKPTIPVVDQTYSSASTNAQSGTAVASAISGKADAADLDEWTATATVSSGGTVTFSGLDDTQGYGYVPYAEVNGNSTEKNPTATINSITGAGTASMTLVFDTTADIGSLVKLRIIK